MSMVLLETLARVFPKIGLLVSLAYLLQLALLPMRLLTLCGSYLALLALFCFITYTTNFIKVLDYIVAQKRPLAYGKHRHKVGERVIVWVSYSERVAPMLSPQQQSIR